MKSVITCPVCGKKTKEEMPEYATQDIYECPKCNHVVRTPKDKHCIFCAYGSMVCPTMQRQKSSGDSETV